MAHAKLCPSPRVFDFTVGNADFYYNIGRKKLLLKGLIKKKRKKVFSIEEWNIKCRVTVFRHHLHEIRDCLWMKKSRSVCRKIIILKHLSWTIVWSLISFIWYLFDTQLNHRSQRPKRIQQMKAYFLKSIYQLVPHPGDWYDIKI